MTTKKEEVLEVLEREGSPLNASDLANKCGIDVKNIGKYTSALEQDGKIDVTTLQIGQKRFKRISLRVVERPVIKEKIANESDVKCSKKNETKFHLSETDQENVVELCNRVVMQLEGKARQIKPERKEYSTTVRIVEKAKLLKKKIEEMKGKYRVNKN